MNVYYTKQTDSMMYEEKSMQFCIDKLKLIRFITLEKQRDYQICVYDQQNIELPRRSVE